MLANRPEVIEAFDISSMSGGEAVGSLVRFTSGLPDKSGYMRFRIKTVQGADDYAMMREVVKRRYAHGERRMPDLIVIDGGRGQLESRSREFFGGRCIVDDAVSVLPSALGWRISTRRLRVSLLSFPRPRRVSVRRLGSRPFGIRPTATQWIGALTTHV